MNPGLEIYKFFSELSYSDIMLMANGSRHQKINLYMDSNLVWKLVEGRSASGARHVYFHGA
jgi:hypothetical protein